MLRKIIDRLLRHRHYWRDVGFDELSELYVSQLFMELSVSMTGIFVPLYMLKLGYSVISIMAVAAFFFGARMLIFDMLAGSLIAKFGPKHTMTWGYVVLIISTLQFLTLPYIHWPIWLLGAIWGATSSLFNIPFEVDFSKVKHKDHTGKEIGYLKIIQQTTTVVGPLISGVVATVFGGQYIFLISILFLIIGGSTLLKTSEPTKINQKLNLRGLKLKSITSDMLVMSATSVEMTMSSYLWPLYLGIFILATGASYAKLGSLASVSVLASILAAFTIGKLIDGDKGRSLLRLGTSLNAAFHLFRPFTNTYPQALLINVLDNPVLVSYQMPFEKGIYGAGDDKGDLRIAYFTTLEWIASIVKTLLWIFLISMTYFWTTKSVMSLGFVIASLASLIIMKEKFRALD